jgi:nitrate reductase assembly molybdenum cofactor insertion protein NarJ
MELTKDEELKVIKSEIKKHLPLLIDFLENKETLEEYSRNLYEIRPNDIHPQRQKNAFQ